MPYGERKSAHRDANAKTEHAKSKRAADRVNAAKTFTVKMENVHPTHRAAKSKQRSAKTTRSASVSQALTAAGSGRLPRHANQEKAATEQNVNHAVIANAPDLSTAALAPPAFKATASNTATNPRASATTPTAKRASFALRS